MFLDSFFGFLLFLPLFVLWFYLIFLCFSVLAIWLWLKVVRRLQLQLQLWVKRNMILVTMVLRLLANPSIVSARHQGSYNSDCKSAEWAKLGWLLFQQRWWWWYKSKAFRVLTNYWSPGGLVLVRLLVK